MADVSPAEVLRQVGSQRRRLRSAGALALAGVCAVMAAERWSVLGSPVLPDVTPPATVPFAPVPHGARAVYRYSVVPGGVWSPRDVSRAIALDPVVADHYRSLDLARVRVETLARPRAAFVSFRQGNRVGWTRRPVRLQAGERVLTDGVTTIRARCGNLVTHQAVADASDERFDPDVLDEIEPSRVAAGQAGGLDAAAAGAPSATLPLDPVPAVLGYMAGVPVGGTSGTAPTDGGQAVLVPGVGLGVGVAAIAVPGGSPGAPSPGLVSTVVQGPPPDAGQPGGTPPEGSDPGGSGTPAIQTPGGSTVPPQDGAGSSPGDSGGAGTGGGLGEPGTGSMPPGNEPGGHQPGGTQTSPETTGGFVATVPEPSMGWLIACALVVWWIYRGRTEGNDAPPSAEVLVIDRDDSLSSFDSENAAEGAAAQPVDPAKRS